MSSARAITCVACCEHRGFGPLGEGGKEKADEKADEKFDEGEKNAGEGQLRGGELEVEFPPPVPRGQISPVPG